VIADYFSNRKLVLPQIDDPENEGKFCQYFGYPGGPLWFKSFSVGNFRK